MYVHCFCFIDHQTSPWLSHVWPTLQILERSVKMWSPSWMNRTLQTQRHTLKRLYIYICPVPYIALDWKNLLIVMTNKIQNPSLVAWYGTQEGNRWVYSYDPIARQCDKNNKKSSITINIKSTMGFPTSYRWSVYVTPKSRKGGSKSDFFRFFGIKVNFNRIVCDKVSLCENFQRQTCSTAILLSNGP